MKQIDRRKFLFGAGGSIIALPWLEMNAEDAVTKKFKDPSLRFASLPLQHLPGRFGRLPRYKGLEPKYQ